MGCTNCSVSKDGTPSGCGDKGHCSSGSCNKKNTFDWLAMDDFYDPNAYPMVEISFKKGARKDFFHLPDYIDAITGDMVVVESSNGYDVGRVTLSGELVRLQMKKKNTTEGRVEFKVLRRANQRDLEKLEEARSIEHRALVNARQLARTLDLDMKLGDVEFQGDKRKATFYYTAEGRVDFRELVRIFAKEFRVKIEMRQIGSRQESARIGGIGSCGRELCCSTWLSDFKSVNTSAARYQNISINQTKLSGQCGRLKCCLNFELDMYIEALEDYPQHIQKLWGNTGRAELLKVDIFKKLMYYSIKSETGRIIVIGLTKEQVLKIKAKNEDGDKEVNILSYQYIADVPEAKEEEHQFADVTGVIELPSVAKKKKPYKKKRHGRKPDSRGGDNRSRDNRSRDSRKPDSRKPSGKRPDSRKPDGNKPDNTKKS